MREWWRNQEQQNAGFRENPGGHEDTASRRAHPTHTVATAFERIRWGQLRGAAHEIGVIARNYQEPGVDYVVVPLPTSEVTSSPIPFVYSGEQTPGQKKNAAPFYAGADGETLFTQPRWHRRRWTPLQWEQFEEFRAEVNAEQQQGDRDRVASVVVLKQDYPRDPGPPYKPAPRAYHPIYNPKPEDLDGT